MAFNLWMIDSGDHYVDENGKVITPMWATGRLNGLKRKIRK